MIKQTFLFPQYYVQKTPYCDECSIPLVSTGVVYMSDPPLYEYKCSNCGKTYTYKETEIQGEWRWRSI